MKVRLFLLGLLLPTLWSIPIFSGYVSAEKTNRFFLGWMRADDFHRYANFIEQTAQLNRLIYEEYSAVEPQSPRIIAGYFTVLGIFEKLLPIGAQYWWFISRFLSSLVFIFVLNMFILKWTGDKIVQHTVLFWVLFSSGWTILFQKAGYLLPRSKNFWMDGFSTFDTFHNPLKILGITIGLLILIEFSKFYQTNHLKYIIRLVCLVLIAWIVHPNSAIPAYCALAGGIIYSIWKKYKEHKNINFYHLAIIFIPFSVILFYIYWMNTDPVTESIIRQYRVPFSYEPLKNYLMRYGYVLLFGLAGVVLTLNARSIMSTMLLAWLGGAIIFARLPYMTGLLFQHMVHLPMSIFAAEAMIFFLRKIKTRFIKVFVWGMLSGMFLIHDGMILQKVSKQTVLDVWPNSLYISLDDKNVLSELRKLPDGNVLVGSNMGNKIAWLSLKKVFLGHWGTTPHKKEKKRILKNFFSSEKTNSWKNKVLKKYNIRYIYYGKDEKRLGKMPDLKCIKLILKKESVELYIVHPSIL